MKQYVKKPVAVEAMQLTYKVEDSVKATEWLKENGYPWLIGNALEPETLKYPDQEAQDSTRPDKGIWINPVDGSLMIRTLEGDMRASLGDFIIKGVKGEFYPCRQDIFEETYEEVKP